MSSASDLDREQEGWERTQSALARVLPYLLLAVSTAITVMQAMWGVPVDISLALGLTGAAALWLILFIVASSRPWNLMLVSAYYAGFAVLSAALVVVAPWYGIFAFVGYLHAFECLRGRWRYVGVVSTSMTMSVTYMGGIDRIDREEWWLWATVTVVGIGLSSIFFSGAETLDRHSLRQRRAVAELHEANTRLSSALEENSALQERLITGAREAGVLAERQRMAREIHDTLAQGLAGILTQLEAAETQDSSEAIAVRHLRTARELARDSLAEARRSVHAVQPSELSGTRLPEALEAVSARWSQVNATSPNNALPHSALPHSASLHEASIHDAAPNDLPSGDGPSGDIPSGDTSIDVECTGTPRLLDSEVESALLRRKPWPMSHSTRPRGGSGSRSRTWTRSWRWTCATTASDFSLSASPRSGVPTAVSGSSACASVPRTSAGPSRSNRSPASGLSSQPPWRPLRCALWRAGPSTPQSPFRQRGPPERKEAPHDYPAHRR